MPLVRAWAVSALAGIALVAGVAVGGPGPAPAAVRAARLPMPAATARGLPDGVFYLLVAPKGPGLPSYDIWRVDNSGREVQLTHDHAISDMGASKAGIVMADAAGAGVDELARLTAHGAQYLPGGHCTAPVISPGGRIACVAPPSGNGSFRLELKKSFLAKPTAIYRQRLPFGGLAWGPHDQVATMSGSSRHPYSLSRLLVLNTDGGRRVVPTGLSQLVTVTWGAAADLAVAGPRGGGEIITRSGARRTLPGKWIPGAWNTRGSTLLVQAPGQPGRLGLWSLRAPHTVVTLGYLNRGVIIWIVGWLAHPAPL